MPPPHLSRTGYPRGGLHGQIVHAHRPPDPERKIRPGELLPADRGCPRAAPCCARPSRSWPPRGWWSRGRRPEPGCSAAQAWNLLDPDVLAWQQDGASPRGVPAQAHRSAAHRRAGGRRAGGRSGPARPSSRPSRGPTRTWRPRSADGAEDYEAFDRADMRFHQGIVRACGNDLLEQMGHVVYSALLLSFQATSRLPGRAKESLPKHRAILDAIRDRQRAARGPGHAPPRAEHGSRDREPARAQAP